jgi:hypothetical protein
MPAPVATGAGIVAFDVLRLRPDACECEELLTGAGIGQPFLDLRAAREVLDDPGQLGQPEDALAGQVAECATPTKGSRWRSQTDRTGMDRARTSSS